MKTKLDSWRSLKGLFQAVCTWRLAAMLLLLIVKRNSISFQMLACRASSIVILLLCCVFGDMLPNNRNRKTHNCCHVVQVSTMHGRIPSFALTLAFLVLTRTHFKF